MGEGRTIQVTEAAMQNILALLTEARDVLFSVHMDDATIAAGLWQGEMLPRTIGKLDAWIAEIKSCTGVEYP